MCDELDKIREIVKKIMGEEFSHGYPHVERVEGYAGKIIEGEKLQVDKGLLTTCILLHDVGRKLGEPHAYYSAIFADGLLHALGYNDEIIGKITNCILYHSFSYVKKHRVKPETIEALVVSDADKLDALGVIGFARLFAFSALNSRNMDDTMRHVAEKLYRLPSLLYFETSRKIATVLIDHLKKSIEELINELNDIGIDIHISNDL
jgi:uncharacterized protein